MQIENDDNHKQNKINNSQIITEQGKQRKIEDVHIKKDDNYKQNKINNLPVITEKEEGNNAGCCNRCCNLF